MRKLSLVTGIIVLGLLATACSSNNDTNEAKSVESGYKVEHVHGLAYTKDDSIYLASHKGLLETKDQGSKWEYQGNVDFDFMGFHVQSDGTMLTSGHPGPESDLPDPLGLMVSKDNGGKWESKSLKGEVDFHVLTSNQTNPKLLFGVIQMDSGDFKAGIYKSTDRGEKWIKLNGKGLLDDLHGIYSIVSLPNDENVLIAGTNQGVYRSEDGGNNWTVSDDSRLITSLTAIPGSSDIMSYSITEGEAGIMRSKDKGVTWEKIGLDLGKDAVAYFAIQPEETNKMAVVTYENNLLVSEDGGKEWKTLMDKGKLKN